MWGSEVNLSAIPQKPPTACSETASLIGLELTKQAGLSAR